MNLVDGALLALPDITHLPSCGLNDYHVLAFIVRMKRAKQISSFEITGSKVRYCQPNAL